MSPFRVSCGKFDTSVLEKIASDIMRLNRIHVYDIDHVLNSQNTPHILSLWLSYGVSSILEKIAGDIMIMRLKFFLNSLRPRQNGRHFAEDIFKCIFSNENVWIPIKISLKFVPNGPIKDIPALVQIMAWRRPGDKPLSEPVVVSLLTNICITRPRWVNGDLYKAIQYAGSWFSH